VNAVLPILCCALAAAQKAAQEKPQDPAPAPAPAQQEERKLLWSIARVERGNMVTLFYRTGHLALHGAAAGAPGPGKWFAPILEKFIDPAEGEWVQEAEHLHTLTITVRRENEKIVTDVLRALDVAKPQVYMEAKVVEVIWSKDEELGFEGALAGFRFFEAANPGALLQQIGFNFRPPALGTTANPDTFRGVSFRFSGQPSKSQGTFDGILRAFVERGKAQVRATPSVLVNSGSEATFKAVDRVPIPKGTITIVGPTQEFTFEEVGTTVKLHPHVLHPEDPNNRQIDLDVDVTLSTIARFEQFSVGGSVFVVPVITSRSSKSSLTVTDNAEVVISGIVQRTTSEFTRGIPYLSDIPILGAFLRSRGDEAAILELIIIVKPRIILPGEQTPILIDPMRNP
jgi:type II secretory pathway component GspD/PulD (secretin)